jgi:hypothetical protein
MIQTYRCRRCGAVLEASLEFVPGIPLASTQQATQARVEAARAKHQDWCPGERPPRNVPKQPKPEQVRVRRPVLAGLWRRRAPG